MPNSILIEQFEENIWKHYYDGTDKGYILSKFYVKQDDNFGKFQIIEEGGSQRIPYDVSNVSVKSFGGAVETNFTSDVELFQRLKQLMYPGFDYSGSIDPDAQTKANISQDIEADQASIIKYPSVKATYDFVVAKIASAIIAAALWLQTGDDIENVNTGLVKIKKGIRVKTGVTTNVGITVTSEISQTADLLQAISESAVVETRINFAGAIDTRQPINGSIFNNRSNFNNARVEVSNDGTLIKRDQTGTKPTLIVQDLNASSTANPFEISVNESGIQTTKIHAKKRGTFKIQPAIDSDEAVTLSQLTGSVGSLDLQGVTDNGSVTDNDISVNAISIANEDVTGEYLKITGSDNQIKVTDENSGKGLFLNISNITGDKSASFPDADGMVVYSVNSTTPNSSGNVSLTLDNIPDGTTNKAFTSTEKTKLAAITGANTGDNATNTTSNAYADAKVADAINDGTTTIAPSQNAVFDALALKYNIPTGTTGTTRYLRGDSTWQSLAQDVRMVTLTVTPVNSVATTGDAIQDAVSKLQGQITALTPLTASAALDFPSTTSQSSSDLTITVTGAAVGKPVTLGVPSASVLPNSSFSAWVSGTNTVTVRFNNYSSGTQNPASGTFTAEVSK